jgi:MFS family permease
MIAASFVISAAILLAAGTLFLVGWLTLTGQVVLWTAMFFFASAAASSAYLTVSELFPLELRALAIAIFYSVGTAFGGIVGPWLFGYLIDLDSRSMLFLGYGLAAALMLIAAILEARLGVDAEGRGLEELAPPLSFSH